MVPSKYHVTFVLVLCIVFFICNMGLSSPFAGGTGEPNDPYQITTAEQLISMGSDPNLLDKHFVLTADIDLDPNQPQGKVFTQAVIAPNVESSHHYAGTPFTGTFKGQDDKISGMMILSGQTSETFLGLFGRIDMNAIVENVGVEGCTIQAGDWSQYVGGLAGENRYGRISRCYVTGRISGGENTHDIGGVVGLNYGSLQNCFWDTETSGITQSWDGIGLTTIEMQTLTTYTQAGWDFTGETANGTDDIWTLPPGDYPHLTWEP